MAVKFCVLMGLIGIASSLVLMASAESGTATFYTNYVPSACFGGQEQGVMIAAVSDSSWNGGAICGKTFKVTCTGSSNPAPQPCTGQPVTVKIVDHCPGCEGTFTLSKEAFTALAGTFGGSITIGYEEV